MEPPFLVWADLTHVISAAWAQMDAHAGISASFGTTTATRFGGENVRGWPQVRHSTVTSR
jgi:hypothetical protein